MLKEMFRRVQSELRDAKILIIVEDWGIVVQKEMFGQVQSELRDACNAEEAAKRLSDSSGNQQLSGEEAEIEKLSGNKQTIKQVF